MISIIIINYNVSKYLKSCIESIYDSDIKSQFEIIVIDNNSTESLDADLLLNNKKNQVKFIKLDDNMGFAGAANYAIRKSSGSEILLLNPDTLVDKNTVQLLADYITGNTDVGVVGCKVIFPSGKYQLSSKRHFPTIGVILTKLFKLDRLFSKNQYFGKYNYTYLNHDDFADVDSISGACMMFRKEMFENIGRFDENFFLYFEDTDFCYRILKKQYKVVYNPNCKIVHYKRESFKNSNLSVNLEFYKSLYIFYNKYIGDYKNNYFTKIIVKYILLFYVKLLSLFNRK